MLVTDTGKSCTESGSSPASVKIAERRGPTAGSVASPRAAAAAAKKRDASAKASAPAGDELYQ